MIDIRPDPKKPRGGFAEVSIAGGTATMDPVMVAVFNSYQKKWLGPTGWQPNRAEIPSRAVIQDGDTLRLVVGPDIVNHIEEDTPIRIEICGEGWDTYWPDDINSGPDEAVIGDIGGTGASLEAKGPTTVIATPELDNSVDVLSQTDDAKTVIGEGTERPESSSEGEADKSKGRILFVLAALAVAAALAIMAYFSLMQTEESTAAPPEPEPVEMDHCAVSELTSLGTDQGFAAVADKMRECGDSLTADNALGFVERAAAAEDPAALALFGALYDRGVTDDLIEDTIGLTFSDQPARAAEYYARAVAAGSDEASARLQAVCRRLLLEQDTLAQSAREDYCQ